ncbi:MAG: N-acetylmuramoyl-L-alanine amidase [Thermodesulfobacteriota bacterium]
MISIFIGKNEFKIRQNILRGVYEENLLMLSRGRPALSRRRPFPLLKRVFLPAVLCIFAILIPGQHMESSFAPAEPTANMRILLASLPQPADPTADRSVPPAPHFAAGVSTEPTSDMNNYPLLPVPSLPSEGAVNSSEFSAFLNNHNAFFSRMLGLKIKTIMIDPGHGGTASGTIGKMGTMEKDITLDIAKRLKTHLVKSGRYRVLMTREDDSSVSLEKRVTLSQEAKADLFISIHLNYLPRKPTNIVETYYFGPSNDEKTLKLAQQENAGSEYGLSDFKEVMERLGKTMKLQESKEFAESIQANLFLNSRKHSEDIQNHGVKRAPFVVLLGVDVPAVLAEVSCLSNREEERELNSESHRENIAGYLAAGIFDYLSKGALTHEAKR